MEITTPKGRKFMSLAQFETALKNDLDEIAKKVLEDVAEEVKKKMKELIDLFYSQHQPKYYDQTRQLEVAVENAESKIYKTNDGWKIHIQIFDTDSMSQTWAEKEHYFNSYLDFSGHATSKGKRYTDWSIDWIEAGSIYGHTAIPVREEINALLDKKVNDGILIEMKRAGYNLK